MSAGAAISGLNNSQSSKQYSENDLRRMAGRYEIVTDDLEPL